ncbi:MAG: hypothetical protein B6I20_06075 [Bacteroidetes bacterium 4572_117]|nr:MAG: hypothetical protein B6I20_06075 [Bacteroidetes bacterium 4572_117]
MFKSLVTCNMVLNGLQKKIIAFLAILVVGVNVFSQINERFEHLTRIDGLSHDNVYSILQDKYGFIWFGTQDGLNKYDGYSFEHFYHESANVNSLISSNFGKIFEDSKGNLWLGTYISGLDCYNPIKRKFKHFVYDENDSSSLSSNRIRCIGEDVDGFIWVGTAGGGLNKLDPITGESVRFVNRRYDWNSVSDNDINTLVFDSNNKLWIGTDVGLDLFDIKNNLFTHYELGKESFDDNKQLSVRHVIIDKLGILWIGTSDGLFVLDPEINEIREYSHDLADASSLSNGMVNTLLEDSEGTIWVGTENGLNKYDKQKNTFVRHTYNALNPYSISSNRIWSLYEDKSNILWVGTKGGGINKLDLKRKKFNNQVYNAGLETGIPYPSISAITGDTIGNLWVGTDGGGLYAYIPKQNKYHYFRTKPYAKNTISDDEIWSICTDSQNRVWVGTHSGGLNKIENVNGEYLITRYLHKPEDSASISNNQINATFQDKDLNIWVATRNGLNKLIENNNAGKAFFKKYLNNYSNPNTLSDNYITSVYQDYLGFIWVGTYSEGLNVIDENNNIITRFKNVQGDLNSLSGNSINTIFEDHQGVLWVGTNDGLNKLDRTDMTFKRYSRNNGLPSNEIMSILEDNSGYLWIATSSGLSKFDAFDEKFINFDISDGLINDGFNWNAAYKDKEGEIYFGTNSGMVSFFPKEIVLNTYLPPVVITSVKILNNQIWVEKVNFVSVEQDFEQTLELDYNNNIFTIEFAAFDYTNPDENNFEYKIEGLDDNWVYYGNKRSITVTNLEPGNYVFRVRAISSDKQLNENGVAIKIKVKPPFWRSKSFIFILVLLAVLAVISIYSFLLKLKTNKMLEEKNKQLKEANNQLVITQQDLKALNNTKDKFFSIIAHDLRNPFTPLLALTELLHDDYDSFDEKERREFIKDIRDGAQRLYDLLENLLQWSLSQTRQIKFSMSKIEMKELINKNIELLKINTDKKKIEINSEVRDTIYVQADVNMMNSIVRNLINNAIKFSEKSTKITIGSKDIGSEYCFSIKDEGIGIKPEYIDHIFDAGFSKTKINKSKEKGSGLGLILCKEFVEKNNGKIWVESKQGLGSTFYFSVQKAE